MGTMHFPDPRNATPEGIVAVGGALNPESLLKAYRMGIFPWPIENFPLTWFCPPERGILEFKDLNIPRSLAKERAKTTLKCTIDKACPEVIQACAAIKRAGLAGEGTWIIPEMIDAYI